MMAAIPLYRHYAGGMNGGPDYPLGPRALYLYRDGRDTFFHLHGTETTGQAVSSGCIRLFKKNIIDLYDRVTVGTHVNLYHFTPDTYVANDLYKPMVLGQNVGPHPALLSDEAGDNISQQASYCEMRGHYYVWKNALSGCDYVGFQHYRRLMFFDHMQSVSRHLLFASIRRSYLSDPNISELFADEAGFKVFMDAAQALSAADL